MLYRFRFVWNKATHRHRHARKIVGLALVTEEESAKGHFRTVWLDVRVLAKVSAVVLVAGWFAAAGGLWLWLNRNPHNRVGFVDLVAPWRWEGITRLRGQGYLDAGLDHLRNGRISEGLFAIRQGLARCPDAPAARLKVAGLFARSGHYAGVRDIMLPQLQFTPLRSEFVRFLVQVALASDDHATVVAACERALAATSSRNEAERGWLLEQKAAALLALQKPDEALKALDAAEHDRSLDWRRLRVLALVAADRAAQAADEIRAWPASGVPQEFRLQLLATACRKAGRREEMVAALRELQRLHPAEPQPWAEAIGHYVRAGMRDAAWNELQDALRRFDAKSTAVAILQRAGVEAGAPELVARCVESAREFGRPLVLPLFDLAAVQLATGDTAAAAQTFERLLAEDRRQQERVASPALLAVGETARSDGGRLLGVVTGGGGGDRLSAPMRDYLRTLLDGLAQPAGDRAEAHCAVLAQGPFRLGAFVGSAETLAKAGRWTAVEAVARGGLGRFPGSTQLTRWSLRAAEKIAAMASPVATVAQPPVARSSLKPVAKPESTPVIAVAQDLRLLGQEEFFARLDEKVATRDWAGAGELVRAVMAAAPPWLPNVEGDLAWREVRYAFERADRAQLLVLVGQRLRRHKTEVSRAMEVARWYRDRGEAEAARQVVSRVLQEIPGYVPGQKFLQEL